MASETEGHRGAATRTALLAIAALVLCGPEAHAGARRMLGAEAPTPTTEAANPAAATATPAPAASTQDQLAALYDRIQAENERIIDIQGRIADAQDRNANLLGATIGVGLVLILVFGLMLLAMRRAAKGATSAARALPILERAYVFPRKDTEVTAPPAPGPSASVRLTFHPSLTNHGRTPAVLRWINLRHQYLSEPPDGVYEDHARHGAGIVIGAGETQRLGDSELTLPRSEWERARAGDGAIYLHGRAVYRDIFSAQHETYFCWRYDVARRAFAIVESEGLNRYD